MMKDAKTLAVVILSVICVVLFVAFVSSAVNLQKQKTSLQDEVAKKMVIEEQMQKLVDENTVTLTELEGLKNTSQEIRAKLETAQKALTEELKKSESLIKELENAKSYIKKLEASSKGSSPSGEVVPK